MSNQRKGVVWKVFTAVRASADEAVAELLGELFGQSPVTHTDFETGKTTVAVYCAERPTGLRAQRAAFRIGLAQLKSLGLPAGPARLSVRPIRRENWAESWKRHFKPLAIGDALLVKPSWSKRRPKPGQAVVVLDPGLSFGTGQHPTTAFCLRELARRRRADTAQSFLDLGTGSGILAIAAVRLGYAPVRAIDCDPASVRVAHNNARANRCHRKVHVSRRDLTRLSVRPKQSYDVICANLISTLLVSERQRILARLKPGGVLVVAGILKSEFAKVAGTYQAAGLRLVASKVEKEWQSGTFAAVR